MCEMVVVMGYVRFNIDRVVNLMTVNLFVYPFICFNRG